MKAPQIVRFRKASSKLHEASDQNSQIFEQGKIEISFFVEKDCFPTMYNQRKITFPNSMHDFYSESILKNA